jgi:predicted RNA-binding protein with PIN domain
MPYLVDGHNLIPKSGIRLDSADDELELVEALQEFARRERRDVEVYFDGAPPGSAGGRRFGRVTAQFVPANSTADAAIIARLGRLGGAARNWIVVSSDHAVQNAARVAHARSLPSEKFAVMLRSGGKRGPQASVEGAREGRKLTRQEVDDWLKLFRGG